MNGIPLTGWSISSLLSRFDRDEPAGSRRVAPGLRRLTESIDQRRTDRSGAGNDLKPSQPGGTGNDRGGERS